MINQIKAKILIIGNDIKKLESEIQKSSGDERDNLKRKLSDLMDMSSHLSKALKYNATLYPTKSKGK